MTPKKITLAFDIYGTLIDTNGVEAALQALTKREATAVSRLWREKQLEYSFRRGLMNDYKNFEVCTRQALDYACLFFNIDLSENDKQTLLEGYRFLPAFPEVKKALASLKKSGFRMYAFSNGRSPDMVGDVLKNAAIDSYFIDIISADEIKNFKPNPAVYQHFLNRTETTSCRCWLISSNTFDIIGAMSFGMKAAWIQRSTKSVFDPWEMAPTAVFNSLLGLSDTQLI